jgi:predicted O-methyltransferase YrrM
MIRALELSKAVFGWTRGDEAAELARLSHCAPTNAVIVEVGAFLGSGTILLAEPRRTLGSGKVYAVDPFDGSGDSFSTPYYADALARLGGGSMRSHFDRAIAEAGLGRYVEACPGQAADVGHIWTKPVDLLFLDGDQSIEGARAAYDAWAPHLKSGAYIAVHNANPGPRGENHDGMLHLVESADFISSFPERHLIGTTVFARRP